MSGNPAFNMTARGEPVLLCVASKFPEDFTGSRHGLKPAGVGWLVYPDNHYMIAPAPRHGGTTIGECGGSAAGRVVGWTKATPLFPGVVEPAIPGAPRRAKSDRAGR